MDSPIINQFLLLFFYISFMITEAQVQIDYHKAYQQMDLFVNTSHQNFERTFNRRQNSLIKELQQRANQLKLQISNLKKSTSQQTIQAMIMKRKQEKEIQRLKLQMNWRQLTQKLKRLEQEEKKLTNQNSQALFDISNLEMKINQLANLNCKLEEHLKNIRLTIKQNTFVSLPQKKAYESPYKFLKLQKNKNKEQNEKIIDQQNINRKLTKIKQIKKIPSRVLIQFLNQREIKCQIFDILRS